ncbi:hypothetical protein TSUD_246690 [Trifolium subterraneum]|uniref:Reverse transcriptase zinc-binding domain-containing protein n=1 Tax=Trifolium subterraneum TaxID=3900 RepID=A0A2Z6PBK4_TRISU|nr:hypothetical protein TSUD_246690 [Trifolium subterraneum]
MLFGVNISESWLHEAASVMRCKHGRLPFTYLGLPIGGDSRKLCFWHQLVEKIRKRLSGWKCENLSFGGRLILLKSVLSSIPVYFLSFFRAPSGKWVWRCLEERDSLWSLVLKAKYGQEGGWVCFAERVGSVWWRNVNSVRVGGGVRDNRWLVDNICRRVGNDRDTLFWLDPWLEECPLQRSFCRLYDLAENKSVSVADMFEAGWGIGGEAWKWRRRLFAWEEELLLGCVGKLANIFLQVDEVDRWVWKLHSSQSYSVKSAYSYLSASETRISDSFDRFLWLKSVPLKVNIFVWRLFLNRLPTKDNLQKRGSIGDHQLLCSALCGFSEDLNHLFFQCPVYGRLWLVISKWLGISTVLHGVVDAHSVQFCGLGGASKGSTKVFTIIWISVLYVIWRDRNNRIFKLVHESIDKLAERVKLQTFWWLKSSYVLFDFDYLGWRQNPWSCFQTVV